MKKRLKDIGEYIWRPALGLAIVLSLFAVIILPNVHQFSSTPSPFETSKSLKIVNISDLSQNTAFLPARFLQFGLHTAGLNSVAYLRLVSVAFAVLTLVMFFYILRHWYTSRIALMGTFLLGFSSWFLHQSRSAEPDILYLFGMTSLIMIGIWLSEKKYTKVLPVITLLGCLVLYIPGMWLFLAIGIPLAWREILEKWRISTKWLRSLSVVVFFVSLAPLVFGLIKHPGQVDILLGVPENGVLTAQSALNNLIGIGEQLLIRGPDEPLKWLVGTPVLDVFTIFMIILGIYTYRSGIHPIRARAFMLIGLLSVVLITLNGYVTLSLLMPVLYLLAASGVGLLLQQWFSVFPKNPIARNIGVIWICLAIAIVGFYHADRYYIAWPNADSTNKVIDIK